MKQSEAKEFLPLIKAWSEGKTLQMRNFSGVWDDVKDRESVNFEAPVEHYRIKPEPREFWVILDLKNKLTIGVHTEKPSREFGGFDIIHVKEVVND